MKPNQILANWYLGKSSAVAGGFHPKVHHLPSLANAKLIAEKVLDFATSRATWMRSNLIKSIPRPSWKDSLVAYDTIKHSESFSIHYKNYVLHVRFAIFERHLFKFMSTFHGPLQFSLSELFWGFTYFIALQPAFKTHLEQHWDMSLFDILKHDRFLLFDRTRIL